MKTKPIDHDESTYARRVAYAQQIKGLYSNAKYTARIADRLEAKEPLAWQPAGTIPIATLLNPKNTK